MRRLLAVVIVLTALPSILPAQRGRLDRIRRAFHGEDAVEIGLIGGPNRTSATGIGSVDAEIRGEIGGFLSVPIIGRLRLRPEVMVSGKELGATEVFLPPCLPPGGCSPVTQTQEASFTWLQVPVLFETKFTRAIGGWGTPKLYAGPFVAIRLACSFSVPIEVTATSEETKLVQDCEDPATGAVRYNNGDAGFVLGGAIASGGIGIGFRWTRSLVPLAPDQSVTAPGRLIGAKSSTLTLTLELGTRLN